MKSRFLIPVVLLLLLAPAVFASDFGVRAGRYDDLDETFVGAEMVFPVTGGLVFNPNLEYVLLDKGTNGTINADFLYRFGESTVVPYLGAGVGAFRLDNGVFNSTKTAINGIAGVDFKLSFLRPYAQVKYVKLTESGLGNELVYALGLRF